MKMILTVFLSVLLLAACGSSGNRMTEAVYLGVENYGAEEVNRDTMDDFSYRFEIDGRETILKVDPGAKNAEGEYAYPIQNLLKEGYSYTIQIENGTVTSAQEKAMSSVDCPLPVAGQPGKRTLKNFLSTAVMPVGNTLYIYGGGWDWQDVGAAAQTRSIGVSGDWVKFFREHDENYTYRDPDGDPEKKDPAHSYYPYGGYNAYYYAGLDCSGYVGWAVYNVMNTENGQDGYVMSSTKIAKALADKGWGQWTQEIRKPENHDTSDFLPGDVFSIRGHVWICVGTCEDGSILILHSTPAPSRTGQPGGGPEFSAIGESEDCDAYVLADAYMSKYFPEWYARYPVALKDYQQYAAVEGDYAGKFSWNLTGENSGLLDPDGYRNKTPEEIMQDLFSDVS